MSGIIEDSCCDYETVNSINAAVLNPILEQLVATSFFRYFKVFLATLSFTTTMFMRCFRRSLIYRVVIFIKTLLLRIFRFFMLNIILWSPLFAFANSIGK